MSASVKPRSLMASSRLVLLRGFAVFVGFEEVTKVFLFLYAAHSFVRRTFAQCGSGFVLLLKFFIRSRREEPLIFPFLPFVTLLLTAFPPQSLQCQSPSHAEGVLWNSTPQVAHCLPSSSTALKLPRYILHIFHGVMALAPSLTVHT